MLPDISEAFLGRMLTGNPATLVHVGTDVTGFTYRFEQ
jgi:hypothetical protein